MRERILKIIRSNRKNKKYKAFVKNKKTKKIRIIHFGAKKYEQFKDSTKLGFFTRKNHGDKQRRRNYFQRHSGKKTKKHALRWEKRKSRGKWNAKLLSHTYLW